MTTSAETRRGRRNLLLLVALFLGPLVAAWLLYSGSDGWRPSGSAANGELIEPLIELPTDGAPFGEVWTLTVTAGVQCDAACTDALVKTRQVRLTLNKDMDRIGRVLLIASDPALATPLAADHPDLEIVDTRDGDAAGWLVKFPGHGTPGAFVYLVDPLGNLMMRFPADIEPGAMREDLKRLLKLSRIG